MTEAISLSSKQMDQILEFMFLENEGEELYDPETEPDKFNTQVLSILAALEAFGNDPQKAIAYKNQIEEKALKAANEVCVKMLVHLPDAKTDDYYRAFDSIEDAFAYKDKVLAASGKVLREIMNNEYYDILKKYCRTGFFTPRTKH